MTKKSELFEKYRRSFETKVWLSILNNAATDAFEFFKKLQGRIEELDDYDLMVDYLHSVNKLKILSLNPLIKNKFREINKKINTYGKNITALSEDDFYSVAATGMKIEFAQEQVLFSKKLQNIVKNTLPDLNKRVLSAENKIKDIFSDTFVDNTKKSATRKVRLLYEGGLLLSMKEYIDMAARKKGNQTGLHAIFTGTDDIFGELKLSQLLKNRQKLDDLTTLCLGRTITQQWDTGKLLTLDPDTTKSVFLQKQQRTGTMKDLRRHVLRAISFDDAVAEFSAALEAEREHSADQYKKEMKRLDKNSETLKKKENALAKKEQERKVKLLKKKMYQHIKRGEYTKAFRAARETEEDEIIKDATEKILESLPKEEKESLYGASFQAHVQAGRLDEAEKNLELLTKTTAEIIQSYKKELKTSTWSDLINVFLDDLIGTFALCLKRNKEALPDEMRLNMRLQEKKIRFISIKPEAVKLKGDEILETIGEFLKYLNTVPDEKFSSKRAVGKRKAELEKLSNLLSNYQNVLTSMIKVMNVSAAMSMVRIEERTSKDFLKRLQNIVIEEAGLKILLSILSEMRDLSMKVKQHKKDLKELIFYFMDMQYLAIKIRPFEELEDGAKLLVLATALLEKTVSNEWADLELESDDYFGIGFTKGRETDDIQTISNDLITKVLSFNTTLEDFKKAIRSEIDNANKLKRANEKKMKKLLAELVKTENIEEEEQIEAEEEEKEVEKVETLDNIAKANPYVEEYIGENKGLMEHYESTAGGNSFELRKQITREVKEIIRSMREIQKLFARVQRFKDKNETATNLGADINSCLSDDWKKEEFDKLPETDMNPEKMMDKLLEVKEKFERLEKAILKRNKDLKTISGASIEPV